MIPAVGNPEFGGVPTHTTLLIVNPPMRVVADLTEYAGDKAKEAGELASFITKRLNIAGTKTKVEVRGLKIWSNGPPTEIKKLISEWIVTQRNTLGNPGKPNGWVVIYEDDEGKHSSSIFDTEEEAQALIAEFEGEHGEVWNAEIQKVETNPAYRLPAAKGVVDKVMQGQVGVALGRVPTRFPKNPTSLTKEEAERVQDFLRRAEGPELKPEGDYCPYHPKFKLDEAGECNECMKDILAMAKVSRAARERKNPGDELVCDCGEILDLPEDYNWEFNEAEEGVWWHIGFSIDPAECPKCGRQYDVIVDGLETSYEGGIEEISFSDAEEIRGPTKQVPATNPAEQRWKESSKVQSIIFKKAKWSTEKAREWLKAHNFKFAKAHETKNEIRFRQSRPSEFRRFASIPFGKDTGIRAIVAARANPPKDKKPHWYSTYGEDADLRAMEEEKAERAAYEATMKEIEEAEKMRILPPEQSNPAPIAAIYAAQAAGSAAKHGATAAATAAEDTVQAGVPVLKEGWDTIKGAGKSIVGNPEDFYSGVVDPAFRPNPPKEGEKMLEIKEEVSQPPKSEPIPPATPPVANPPLEVVNPPKPKRKFFGKWKVGDEVIYITPKKDRIKGVITDLNYAGSKQVAFKDGNGMNWVVRKSKSLVRVNPQKPAEPEKPKETPAATPAPEAPKEPQAANPPAPAPTAIVNPPAAEGEADLNTMVDTEPDAEQKEELMAKMGWRSPNPPCKHAALKFIGKANPVKGGQTIKVFKCVECGKHFKR